MDELSLLATGTKKFSFQKTYYPGLPKPVKWFDYGTDMGNNYVKVDGCIGRTRGIFEIELKRIVSYEEKFALVLFAENGEASISVDGVDVPFDEKSPLSKDAIERGVLKTTKKRTTVVFIYYRIKSGLPVGNEATPAPKKVIPN